MPETDEKKVRVLRRSRGKLESDIRPIVLEYRERKKKKRDRRTDEDEGEKYSDSLKDVQRLERNSMRVAQRASRAVAKGIDTYETERKRSAREKTDGAIEDFAHNSAKATSTFLKEASEIPLDLADSLDTKTYRKRLRSRLRLASRIIRLWRI
jgi:hypothetical protein